MTEALISAGGGSCRFAFTYRSNDNQMITNSRSNNKMQNDIKTAQAVTDERISELTREVRMHNDFARRIPVIEEQIRVANHRVADLEELHKPNN